MRVRVRVKVVRVTAGEVRMKVRMRVRTGVRTGVRVGMCGSGGEGESNEVRVVVKDMFHCQQWLD